MESKKEFRQRMHERTLHEARKKAKYKDSLKEKYGDNYIDKKN